MNVDRAWLHQFARAVRTVTLDNFVETNTCIVTTRLGLYVLDEFGITARPQPVAVEVWNMAAWHLSEQRVPVSEWPPEAWSLYAGGHGATDHGWDGHLVLIVRRPGEPRLLIDLTADQFDRPDRDLRVGGPVLMGINGPWTPRDSLSTLVPTRESPETVISYSPLPPGLTAARSWREAGDWTRHETELRDAARRIAAILREDQTR